MKFLCKQNDRTESAFKEQENAITLSWRLDSWKCQVALLLQELSPYKIEKFQLRN
jgi:hypothetical protein